VAALSLILFAVFLAAFTVVAAPGFALQEGSSQGEGPAFLQRPSHEEMKAKAEALDAQVAADSTNFELTFELAGVYYDMGSLVMAAKYYDRAAGLDPKSVRALVNYGVVLNEMGKSEEALAVYDKALDIDPKDTKALCNRGLAYYAVGRHQEAVAQYMLALEIDEKAVEAHYNLGVAFADAQIYREAIAEWNKVIEIDPDSDAAKAARANVEVIQQLIDFADKKGE
jgi:tetratricopeptide (TPR) repeat protein